MRTLQEILDYEVRASWWTAWRPFRAFAGWYFAQKVRRKYRRYESSCLEQQRVERHRMEEVKKGNVF